MNYQETVEYLYNSAPLFQQVGKDAYKEGLETTLLLDAHLGHPHTRFKSIHVAGTNGKGSCSHTLAAILQSAGYRVGLYTSPHLVDFRERIRINGQPIPEEEVVQFVEHERLFFEPLHPSFFELVTAMAFDYFAKQQIDVAVVEVGLGGRLDCTNIIRPELGIITNISFDHVQFLGDTLTRIAGEKAGIIKPHIPIIIGEANDETRPVFQQKADAMHAPIYFAQDEHLLLSTQPQPQGGFIYQTVSYPNLTGELGGFCQTKNTNTLLTALRVLQESKAFQFSEKNVRQGFAHVCELTGLRGRWQKLHSHPTVICDTGHNAGGMAYIVEQLRKQPCRTLRMVFGMVNDKDINTVLEMLPRTATYYFTQASVKRAMPSGKLQEMAQAHALEGKSYPTVQQAVRQALQDSHPDDLVFVGGSNFVVADLLQNYQD